MALAAKGHNITSLSPDKDTKPYQNLHYIHLERVYESIYDEGGPEINFIEIGQQNAWEQMNGFYDFSLGQCKGSVQSKGWKQLENYPPDFKVCIEGSHIHI